MQLVVNGVLTNYQDINPDAKKTVVLLHGWANTSDNWLSVAKLLPINFRYLVLDLPGFGQTQFLPDSPDVPEYTEFVLAFIEKLKLSKPVIFGHSFGGQIAMDISIKHPDTVSQIILFSPAGIRLRSNYIKFRLRVFKILKVFKRLIPSSVYRWLLVKFGSTDYANALGKHRDILNQIVKYDLSTQLKNISIPTEIVWGSEDHVIPYMGKFLTENIPSAHLTILYGMGHIPNILQPQDFAAELTKIFKDL